MTMTLLPRGLKVHLALGYTDMRKGVDGLAMFGAGRIAAGPVLGPSVRVPRSQSQPDQNRVLGWDRSVPLHQAALTGRLPMAAGRRSGGDSGAELGAAINADLWRRLARASAAGGAARRS